MRPAIEQALDVLDDTALLVIDVTGLTFLSSSGVAALLETRRFAAARGLTLRIVVGENRRVTRPLQVTGLDEVFRLCRDTNEALQQHK